MREMRTVLVVDDSDADQFLAKRVLLKFDPTVEVLRAHDGREALALLDTLAKPPDVVLLDINMPGMNGFEFLEAYARRDSPASTVMMLTSSASPRDREKSSVYDCVTAYFVKPLSMALLSSTFVVRNRLSGR